MNINRDHIKHAVICAIATFASFAYMSLFFSFAPCLASSWLLPSGLGVGKEYGDSQASGNYWDRTDILADAVGIAIAMAVLLTMHWIAVKTHTK